MKLQKLNLPDFTIDLTEVDGSLMIKDVVRNKWLKYTPEEWVRQHFIQFLIHNKGFPKSLIFVEKGIKVNQLSKRCDIIAYNRKGSAIVLVECKAPNIAINQTVFDQIARYNLKLNVPFLIVTNGMEHYCCQIDFENQKYLFLKDIPLFEKLDS